MVSIVSVSKSRQPKVDPSHICPKCGDRMVPSNRHERGRSAPVPVLWCAEGCGYEDPPFDACCERLARGERPPPVFLTVTCPCGEQFQTTEARRARGRGRYCSTDCRQVYRPKLARLPLWERYRKAASCGEIARAVYGHENESERVAVRNHVHRLRRMGVLIETRVQTVYRLISEGGDR